MVGTGPLANTDDTTLSLPLAFAAGPAWHRWPTRSCPRRYAKGGPAVALSTAAGFLLSFVLSTL